DLAFKYIDPERYAWIEKNVSRKREEKEKYIARVREVIETKLREAGIEGEVSGRVKHRYSIYKKMQERDIDFDDLHDMLAFRVIVENEDDCYPLLGMVHSTWKPVPGRFKDYIAIPKANMYQSLHTTVIGPYGEMMEVQIRTRNMHLVSEYGVAAHWKYKDGEKISDTYHAGLSWLSQMLEMQKDVKDSSEFLETLKIDLFPDEVFVFTPQGEVRELPAGSTPIDFAYSIHTDIGHSCVNARVNGRRVPLSYTLRNGDFVEIETREDARPNAEWIGFVATSRARNRIKQWINAAERKESFELGHELLRKAFLMYGFNFDELIEKGELQEKAGEPLGYDSDEKLILNVGFGKITPGQVVSKIVPPELLKEDGAVKRSVFRQMLNRIRPAAKSSQDKKRPSVIVKGAGDFMVNIANCCNPLPGDEITGYLTPERGILVHSYDCPSLLSSDYERRIDVEWEEGAERVTPVKIVVFCKNDVGLLADIAIALKEQDANIASAKVRSTSDNRAVCAFDVSVRDIVHLRNVIRALKDIKKVIKVKRVGFDKHGKPLRRVAS
ncbi:MAG: bifunctional (p)ppGpp synthetase/guanosine-3',5'-bis(diphosphate) 3'-pyrophosphohydrolase, partial [Deltaproteobacteria bacterium]|nr:bifunctional (p)ppGpp synthetase/guanosine-3',5'-bis(diphosphate) 3'-pyrophosphohydrolase [Deltaproteobacteria bacterium]